MMEASTKEHRGPGQPPKGDRAKMFVLGVRMEPARKKHYLRYFKGEGLSKGVRRVLDEATDYRPATDPTAGE